jgi:hypothetical protein
MSQAPSIRKRPAHHASRVAINYENVNR